MRGATAMSTARIEKHRAAQILGCSPRAVVSMAAAGKLAAAGAAKLCREWTFDEKRLRAYVRQKEAEACVAARQPDEPGCYWRGNTLWGRVHVRGKEFCRSLDTDDAKVAKSRRAALKARLLSIKHGDTRKTFAEGLEDWKDWIPTQVLRRSSATPVPLSSSRPSSPISTWTR
jgi:hypothetical protein